MWTLFRSGALAATPLNVPDEEAVVLREIGRSDNRVVRLSGCIHLCENLLRESLEAGKMSVRTLVPKAKAWSVYGLTSGTW